MMIKICENVVDGLSTWSIFGGIGCALGGGLSYAYNQSILWAILHYMLGWAYVAYKLASMYLINPIVQDTQGF